MKTIEALLQTINENSLQFGKYEKEVFSTFLAFAFPTICHRSFFPTVVGSTWANATVKQGVTCLISLAYSDNRNGGK